MKKNFLILLSVALTIVGCESRIDLRGKDFDPKVLVDLKPGITTQADVVQLVGSPSSRLTFDENVWMYAYKVTETTSFFEPKVLKSSIVRIRFNDKGIVEEVVHSDGEGHLVEPVKRATKTVMEEKSWTKQIFGNFGRTRKKKN